jgi:hypothetical protein
VEKFSAALQSLQSTGHAFFLPGPAANPPTATILHTLNFTSHWEESLTSNPEQAVLKSLADETDDCRRGAFQPEYVHDTWF